MQAQLGRVLPVVLHPSPLLRAVCLPVTDFAAHAQLFEDLRASAAAHGGLGLAAPQVGENLRIALVEIPENSPRYPGAPAYPFGVYINPRIHVLDKELQGNWEGCLSVPGMRGFVERTAPPPSEVEP